MIEIAVVTTTRAEFGLLLPVLKQLRKYENEMLMVRLVVSGTHLSEAFGMTVNEINESGIRIDELVPVMIRSDNATDISNTFAEVLKSFAELFHKNDYSAVLLLGDRYEALAVAIAAGITGIPVFHMCGGDTTEGAVDEWMRHSISKIAYLHFVTNEVSRRRLMQLGEAPERIFDYGSTSIDNIMGAPELTKKETLNSIGLDECDYALCTYHPVTTENEQAREQVESLLKAVSEFPNIKFIFTKANADQNGEMINSLLEESSRKMSNVYLFSSLGVKRYITLMKHCMFVLGNSSSGIIEAPACKVPTVNIGDRQRGRLRADSVIDCENTHDDICDAIKKACSKDFTEICRNTVSPYGIGNTGERIAEKCIETVMKGPIDLKKHFYDIGEAL